MKNRKFAPEELAGLGLLCHVKAEGKAMHPDDALSGSDEAYLRQLQAYADWYGIEETKAEGCSRPELLDRLVATP